MFINELTWITQEFTDNKAFARSSSSRMTLIGALPKENDDSTMNAFAPLLEQFANTGNASEIAYSVLRQAILSNILTPGTRLLADELAIQLGVSRTPVREALRKLQAQDLITVSTGNVLSVKILTEQQIQEIYYTREALEGMAARLASENARRIDVDHLRTVLQDIETAQSESNLGQVRAYTGEFQLLVFKAAHNDIILNLLTTLSEQVRNHRLTTMNIPGRDAEVVSFCRDLLKAIEKRDPDAAESIARANRRRTLELRIKMMRANATRS
jgi:DNA-binding GntR family transcriptional regulator